MTHYHERPVAFGPGRTLIGVHTLPADPRDRPAILFLNAGILHRVGPNRMHVELARRLAALGYQSLRFDLAGIGDSATRTDGRALGEGVAADIDAALAEVRSARLAPGAHRASVVAAGLCAGADNALRAAARDPGVVGAVLLDPTVFRSAGWYVRRWGPRLADPDAWRFILTHRRTSQLLDFMREGADSAAPVAIQEGRPEFFYTGFRTREEVEAHLQAVLARRVHLYYAFTGGWSDIYNGETQLLENHPSLPFRGYLRLRYFPEADHTYSDRAIRERFFADLIGWFDRIRFEKGPAHPQKEVA